MSWRGGKSGSTSGKHGLPTSARIWRACTTCMRLRYGPGWSARPATVPGAPRPGSSARRRRRRFARSGVSRPTESRSKTTSIRFDDWRAAVHRGLLLFFLGVRRFIAAFVFLFFLCFGFRIWSAAIYRRFCFSVSDLLLARASRSISSSCERKQKTKAAINRRTPKRKRKNTKQKNKSGDESPHSKETTTAEVSRGQVALARRKEHPARRGQVVRATRPVGCAGPGVRADALENPVRQGQRGEAVLARHARPGAGAHASDEVLQLR